ncbi:MAG TPA: hypothetical protein VGJ15_11425 [Pirellulales bacterium]
MESRNCHDFRLYLVPKPVVIKLLSTTYVRAWQLNSPHPRFYAACPGIGNRRRGELVGNIKEFHLGGLQ